MFNVQKADGMMRRKISDTDSEHSACLNSEQIRERAKKAWEDAHVERPLLREMVNPCIQEHVRKNFRRSVVRRALHPNIVTSTPCVSASAHQYPNISPIISVTDVENHSDRSAVKVDKAALEHHTTLIPNIEDEKKESVHEIEALNVSGLHLINEELGKQLLNENEFASTSKIKRSDHTTTNRQNKFLADISRSVQDNAERLSSLSLNKNTDGSKSLHSGQRHQASVGTAHMTHPIVIKKNSGTNTECMNLSRFLSGTNSEEKDPYHQARKNKTSVKKENSDNECYCEENKITKDVHNVVSTKTDKDEKHTSKEMSCSGLTIANLQNNLHQTNREINRRPCDPLIKKIDTTTKKFKRDDSQKAVEKDKSNSIVPHRSVDRSRRKETNKLKKPKKSSRTAKHSKRSKKQEKNLFKANVREIDSSSIINDVSSNGSQSSLVSNDVKRNVDVEEFSSEDVTSSSSFQERKPRSKSKRRKERKIDLKYNKYHTKKYKTKDITSSNPDWEKDRRDDKNISKFGRRGISKCRRCTKYSLKGKYITDSSVSESFSLDRDLRRDERIRRYNNEDVSRDRKSLYKEKKKLKKKCRSSPRSEIYYKYMKRKPLKKSRIKSIATKKNARNTRTSYKYRRSSYSDSDLETTEDSNDTIDKTYDNHYLRRSKLKKQHQTKHKEPVESMDTQEMLLSNPRTSIEEMETKDKTKKLRQLKLNKLQQQRKYKVPVESVASEEMQNSRCTTPVDDIEAKDKMSKSKLSKLKKLQRQTNDKVPIELMHSRDMQFSKTEKHVDQVEGKDNIEDVKLENCTTNSMIYVQKKTLEEMVKHMVKSAMFGSEKGTLANHEIMEDNLVKNHTKGAPLQEVKAVSNSTLNSFRSTIAFTNPSEYSLLLKPLQRNYSSNSEFGTFRPSGSSTIVSHPEVCSKKKSALRKIARKPFTKLDYNKILSVSNSSDFDFCFYKKTTKQRGGNETPNNVGEKKLKRGAGVKASKKKLTFQKVKAISPQTSSGTVHIGKNLSTSQRKLKKAKIDEALGIHDQPSVIGKERIIESAPKIVDRKTESSPFSPIFSIDKKLTNSSKNRRSELSETASNTAKYSLSKKNFKQTVGTQSSPFLNNVEEPSNSLFPLYHSLRNSLKKIHDTTGFEVVKHSMNESSSYEKATNENDEGIVHSEIFKRPQRVSNRLQSSRVKLKFDSEDINRKKRSMSNLHNIELEGNRSSHKKIQTLLSESEHNPAQSGMTLSCVKEGSSCDIMTVTVHSSPGNDLAAHNSKKMHSTDSSLVTNEKVSSYVQTDTGSDHIPLIIPKRKSDSHESIETSQDHPPQSNIKLLQNITLKRPVSNRSVNKSKEKNDSSCVISKTIDIQEEKVFIQPSRNAKNQKKKSNEPIKAKRGRKRIASYSRQPEDNEPNEGMRKSTRERRPPQAIYWKSTLAEEEVLRFENCNAFMQNSKHRNIQQDENKKSAKIVSTSKKNTVKKETKIKEVNANVTTDGSSKRVGKVASGRNPSPEPEMKRRKVRMSRQKHCKVTEEVQRNSTSELEDDPVRKFAVNIFVRSSQDADDLGYMTTDHENETPHSTSAKVSNSVICRKLFDKFLHEAKQINGSPELEGKCCKSIDVGNAISSGQHFGYHIMAPSQAKSAINSQYDVVYYVLDGRCSLYMDNEKFIKQRKEVLVINQGTPYKIENEQNVALELAYMCYKKFQ